MKMKYISKMKKVLYIKKQKMQQKKILKNNSYIFIFSNFFY